MLIAASIAAAVAFIIATPGAALLDRKAPSAPAQTFTPYTGPLYTAHGRERA